MKYFLIIIFLVIVSSIFLPIIPFAKTEFLDTCDECKGGHRRDKGFYRLGDAIREVSIRNMLDKMNNEATIEVEDTASQTAYDEFKALRESAIRLTLLNGTVKNISTGKEICDTTAPNPICLSYAVDQHPAGWEIDSEGFIEKPIEGGLYLYEQLGDMDLVMVYKNSNWEFPDIDYLLRITEMNIAKLADSPYRVFAQGQGDACSVSKTFMIDPKIADFPYWLQIMYVFDACDESVNISEVVTEFEKDFVESLEISAGMASVS